MTVTMDDHQVVQQAIDRLPPHLASPDPSLRQSQLSVNDTAKYVTGRLLTNALCNITPLNGGEIHGRWRFTATNYTKIQINDLARHIKKCVESLFYRGFTCQIMVYNIQSKMGISPVSASDITIVLTPRTRIMTEVDSSITV
jgi:hypothetical protein